MYVSHHVTLGEVFFTFLADYKFEIMLKGLAFSHAFCHGYSSCASSNGYLLYKKNIYIYMNTKQKEKALNPHSILLFSKRKDFLS